MISVRSELLCRELPVAGNDPLLDAGDRLGPLLTAVEHNVHIEFDVTQVFVERRRVGVPVGKNQALVGFDARLLRSPLRLVQATTEGFLLHRYAYQIATLIVCPTMVGTCKGLSVARIGPADPHSAVLALV